MLKALIRSKLSPAQENMEDILTSNVFGSLEMCGANRLLFDFLRQAKTLGGKSLFDGATDIMTADYSFWPRFQECDDAFFREPDVELNIVLNDGRKFKLFIEAKFLSGKSSFDEDSGEVDVEDREADDSMSVSIKEVQRSNDQLASQWVHLTRAVVGTNQNPALIFLTADTAAPKSAIEESRVSARKVAGKSVPEFECYWLSWRHLYSILKRDGQFIEKDLLSVLDYLELHFFHGFRWPNFPDSLEWKFLKSPTESVVLAKNTELKLPIGMVTVPQPLWRFNS